MKAKPTIEQVLVTPQIAEAWLSEHFDRIAKDQFRNRRIREQTVNKYASDMRAKLWQETPEPIIFDENSDLVDGQHRLLAIKASGVELTMMVARNWPKDVISSINHGRSRSVSDILMMSGTKNSAVTAAAVSGAVRVCYGGRTPSVSYAACVHVLDRLGLRPHIEHIVAALMAGGIKPTGRVVGPLAFYRTVSRKKADEFLDRFVNANTEKGTGVQLFTKYSRHDYTTHQSTSIMALCACLRLWDSGETAEYVKSTPQACEWLANENKKLKAAIVELCGSRVSGN